MITARTAMATASPHHATGRARRLPASSSGTRRFSINARSPATRPSSRLACSESAVSTSVSSSAVNAGDSMSPSRPLAQGQWGDPLRALIAARRAKESTEHTDAALQRSEQTSAAALATAKEALATAKEQNRLNSRMLVVSKLALGAAVLALLVAVLVALFK